MKIQHAQRSAIFRRATRNPEWDYKDQPPEFWGQFATANAEGEHVRVQPLLDWREVDIWRYIQRGEHSHSENVFRARWKTFSIVRL